MGRRVLEMEVPGGGGEGDRGGVGWTQSGKTCERLE